MRILALFLSSLAFAASAHAAGTDTALTLSLFRAVRLSDTSLSISFKTSESAIAQIRYAQLGGSEIQLTDSAPQRDHLFTVDSLDADHGYSFTLSASAGAAISHEYVVLLAPSSIGAPGQSIAPIVQVVGPDGAVIDTLLSASSTPVTTRSVVPWWVFALLFVVVVGGWVGYFVYTKRRVP